MSSQDANRLFRRLERLASRFLTWQRVAHAMGYPRKVTLAGGGPPAFLVRSVS
jgi:hypothetical protein